MVRAVKLEKTPSGSYYNASQGVFGKRRQATFGISPAGDMQITVPAITGRTYRFLWSTNLAESAWTPFPYDLYATNREIACSITPEGSLSGQGWFPTNLNHSTPVTTNMTTTPPSDQRFFRILSQPL